MTLPDTNSRGFVLDPAVVEIVVAPVPPVAIPVEVTNAENATVAIDRSPEGNHFTLPLFGNEVRVLQQVIQNAGIQDRFVRELLTEIVATDHFATHLLPREEQKNLILDPAELSTLDVLLDGPTIRNHRIGVAIDHMLDRFDFR